MKVLLENWRKYALDEGKYDDLTGKTRAPRGIPQKAVNIISGYVIDGIQPSGDDAAYLADVINSGNRYVKWYKGTAYRGLMVSEEWLDAFFNLTLEAEAYEKDIRDHPERHASHAAPDQAEGSPHTNIEKRRKAKEELLTKPDLLNFFKKLKGVITMKLLGVEASPKSQKRGGIFGAYKDWGKGARYSGTLVGREVLMESWSSSYSVAADYATPGRRSHRHQWQGFEWFLVSQSKKETPSKVLSVILEARERGGGTANTRPGFIDISKLYKAIPAMKPERRIKEVPLLNQQGILDTGKRIDSISTPLVHKIHVPYAGFRTAFEKVTKDWSPRQRAKVSPLIKEAAEEAGIILT